MTEQQAALKSHDDLSLARAVAEAVCQIPAVLELSAGRFAREGTYGPGEFVRGVVLKRPTPDSLEVDVHLVLAEQALRSAFVRGDGVPRAATSSTGGPSLSQPPRRPRSQSAASGSAYLFDLSEQVRRTVRRVLAEAGEQPAPVINVLFDDVR
jgi:hypothetical protein